MKKLLLYSGLISLILLLLVVSVSLFLVMITGARVARARDAITAAGEPLQLTEYAREPIPNEQNAFYYLQQAKADLEAFDGLHSNISEFDYRRRMRPDQLEELAQLVDKFSQQSQLYELIERAADCPDYDEQIDYSQNAMNMLPDVMPFRSAARALEAKALVLAYRGLGDEALDQCDQALRLTSHLQQSAPFVLTHLISIACQGNGVLTTNHVLRVAETSPDAREKLDATIASFDNHQGSIAALKGERAWGVLIFEQLRGGKVDPAALEESSLPMQVVSYTWVGKAYLNDDEAKYLELMDGYIKAAQVTGAQRQSAIATPESSLQPIGLRHRLARQTVPALKAFIRASDRGDTLNHCLRTYLALHDHQQATLAELKQPNTVTCDAACRSSFARQTTAGSYTGSERTV